MYTLEEHLIPICCFYFMLLLLWVSVFWVIWYLIFWLILWYLGSFILVYCWCLDHNVDEFNYLSSIYTNQYIPKINIITIIIWRRPPIFIFIESIKKRVECQQNIVSHLINITVIGSENVFKILLIIPGTLFSFPLVWSCTFAYFLLCIVFTSMFYWYGDVSHRRTKRIPGWLIWDIKIASRVSVLNIHEMAAAV